jgi:AcrR family transcriptional regulator
MDTETKPAAGSRVPLSSARVFAAAIALADREGIDALTMRHLAEELGVEAMSLYYHVANKEAILDGVVEAIVEEIGDELGGFEVPASVPDWKTALRERILIARTVMMRHRWAPAVFETRTAMSGNAIRYFHGIIGLMKEAGFTYDQVHHAMHALGSRALGFTQELFDPEDTETGDEEATQMLEQMADELPYFVAMMMEIAHDDPESTLGWCDDQTEFEFGLDLILDGLDRVREPV